LFDFIEGTVDIDAGKSELDNQDRSGDAAERCYHANASSTKPPVLKDRRRRLLLALVAEEPTVDVCILTR
jgi:hypothetical protein